MYRAEEDSLINDLCWAVHHSIDGGGGISIVENKEREFQAEGMGEHMFLCEVLSIDDSVVFSRGND